MSGLAAGLEMMIRARNSASPMTRDLTWLAIEQFCPCLIGGALVTVVLVRAAPESLWMLPGLWQIFYSLGIFASCRLLAPADVLGGRLLSGDRPVCPGPAARRRGVFSLGDGSAVWSRPIAGRRRALSHTGARSWLKPKAKSAESNGRFAYDGLERVFHEKARLGIMTSLVSQPRGVVFSDLKEMCHLTDGNLSRHLQVLNEAGLVEIWKGFHKNRPQTLCRITDEGRRRFFEYINVLETVVHDAMTAARDDDPAPTTKVNLADGWSPA